MTFMPSMENNPNPCKDEGATRYILPQMKKSVSTSGSSLGAHCCTMFIPQGKLNVTYALSIIITRPSVGNKKLHAGTKYFPYFFQPS